MESFNSRIILGIDCGATKILAQPVSIDPISKNVSPVDNLVEMNYEIHPDWDPDFIPVDLDIQRKEFSEKTINLTESEKKQGTVIINSIRKVISNIDSTFISISENIKNEWDLAICFPGIKNEDGINIMANGPRIPDLNNKIPGIKKIYNDSDCCVLGEWKSAIGKLLNCENAIYIGGGTGIADGIILKGELINFNIRNDIKRSWDLIMENGQSVESLLSPKGMINQWNDSHSEKVYTLSELNKKKYAQNIFKKSADAFSFLIQDRISFFQQYDIGIEKIVIGQRLGENLASDDSLLKELFERKTTIPIHYSTDRRTAALGAAWKKGC